MITIPIFPDLLNIKIDKSPWNYPIYNTQAELSVIQKSDKKYLQIKFTSDEWPVRCYYKNFNEDVYKDSTVEVFLNAYPEKGDEYISFEINAAGVCHSSFGAGRYDRVFTTQEEIENIRIKASLTENNSAPWSIEICIPLDFLSKKFNMPLIQKSKIIKANFYKCGEDTLVEHYNTWSHIVAPAPDFHLPEFFGELFLEV